MRSWAANREIIAKKAVPDLMYSSTHNFEMDVEFLKMRGTKIEIRCMDIEKLKKFRLSIKMLMIPLSKNVERIFEDLDKLDIFSELD